jgi:succinyl-CoA synthetase alpha subunit
MAIFVNENTKVIVQGLTGGQGKYHGLKNKAYGTQVVAGCTARAAATLKVSPCSTRWPKPKPPPAQPLRS